MWWRGHWYAVVVTFSLFPPSFVALISSTKYVDVVFGTCPNFGNRCECLNLPPSSFSSNLLSDGTKKYGVFFSFSEPSSVISHDLEATM